MQRLEIPDDCRTIGLWLAAGPHGGDVFAMKLPARKSTLFLSAYLCLHGGLIVLELNNNPTLEAISGLLAIAAGAFLWLEK